MPVLQQVRKSTKAILTKAKTEVIRSIWDNKIYMMGGQISRKKTKKAKDRIKARGKSDDKDTTLGR